MEFLLSDSVLSSEGRTEDAVRGVSATLVATAVIDVSASTGSRLLLLWMTTAETIMTAAQRLIVANIAFFHRLVRYFMRRRNGFLSSDFFLCTCKLMFPLCLTLPQPASQIAQPQAERRIYPSISIALIFFVALRVTKAQVKFNLFSMAGRKSRAFSMTIPSTGTVTGLLITPERSNSRSTEKAGSGDDSGTRLSAEYMSCITRWSLQLCSVWILFWMRCSCG